MTTQQLSNALFNASLVIMIITLVASLGFSLTPSPALIFALVDTVVPLLVAIELGRLAVRALRRAVPIHSRSSSSPMQGTSEATS